MELLRSELSRSMCIAAWFHRFRIAHNLGTQSRTGLVALTASAHSPDIVDARTK
jgi:hypothetical protein